MSERTDRAASDLKKAQDGLDAHVADESVELSPAVIATALRVTMQSVNELIAAVDAIERDHERRRR